jgi:hypothetical protein
MQRHLATRISCFAIALVLLSWKQDCFAQKEWPSYTLRGIATKLVTPKGFGRANGIATVSDETFALFSRWGINVVRVDLRVDYGSIWDVENGSVVPPVPIADPLAPYQKHLEALETALTLAAKHKIYIIPMAGNIVGRNIDVMYQEGDGTGYYKTLEQLWGHIAKKYGKHPWLLAYDLLNEPNTKNDLAHWQTSVLPRLVSKIREHDKSTYLVVEPGPWGLPSGFKTLIPLQDPRVVYSFHFYAPHNYTHQGVGQSRLGTKGKLTYPGRLRMFDTSPELLWDRNQLLRDVSAAREFQEKYNARIFVGEFSAIRWAPGAATWLRDIISVFEGYGWDWCFHSYGGWNGWNPSFDSDDPQSFQFDGGKVTDRLQVLLQSWAKNTR